MLDWAIREDLVLDLRENAVQTLHWSFQAKSLARETSFGDLLLSENGYYIDLENMGTMVLTESANWSFYDQTPFLKRLFDRAKNLAYFQYNNIHFPQPFPVNLSKNKNLKRVRMTSSMISGTLPEIGIGNMPELYELTLSLNSITGTIPALWNAKKLKKIDLFDNDLTGSIPKELALLPLLKEININANPFDNYTLPYELVQRLGPQNRPARRGYALNVDPDEKVYLGKCVNFDAIAWPQCTDHVLFIQNNWIDNATYFGERGVDANNSVCSIIMHLSKKGLCPAPRRKNEKRACRLAITGCG